MSDELLGLSADDARRLGRMLEAFESGRLDRGATPPRQAPPGPLWTALGRADEGLPAAAGSTPGSGTVALWEGDLSGHYSDSGRAVTAYNPTSAVIPAGTWVELYRDPRSGWWWAAPAGDADVYVRVTGGLISGRYGGVVTSYDLESETWSDGDLCTLVAAHGPLILGRRYPALFAGLGDGDVPAYAAWADEDADATHAGNVSTVAQSFGGKKTFENAVRVGEDAVDDGGVVELRQHFGFGNAEAWLGFGPTAGGNAFFQCVQYGVFDADAYAGFALVPEAAPGVRCLDLYQTDGDGNTLDPCYGLTDSTGEHSGAYGTDALGNVFKGGLCTTVGAGTLGLAVGTTAVSGGTDYGVLYSQGGTLRNVAPTSPGQLFISGSLAWVAMSGDAAITSAGVLTIAGDAVTTAKIAANAVTDARLRQSAGLSVIGRAANSTGDVADVTAASDGQVLRRSGATLGFGTVATAGIGDAQVTLAKIANAAASSKLLGSGASGSGSSYAELSLGVGLSMSGTTLSATGTGGTVTSVDVSGGTTGLTFSGGAVTTSGTITMAGTLLVASGGTGRTSLTSHGVLVGAGTSAVTQLAAGTNGQLLIGQTGADPAFTTASGDVTVSAAGVTAIGTAKVTNAMLVTMAAATVKGRAFGVGTGAPSDLSADQVAAILDTAASPFMHTSALSGGDLYASGASSGRVLPAPDQYTLCGGL